jgi:pyruvate kinase
MYQRKARIVATIGPTSRDETVLLSLIQAGMDVARLNFSHGTYEDHAASIALIRKLSLNANKPITILQDLQGPKLRVGILPPEGVPLVVGSHVVMTSIDEEHDPTAIPLGALIIPMDVPGLSRAVSAGSRVLLDDGNLELQVTSTGTGFIDTIVRLGGTLKSHKGVNLPLANLDTPSFTEKDRADLAFGLEQGVDAVAISFVQTADDVIIVKQAIASLNPARKDTPVIAKLERPEAIDHLDEILTVADGVMVARGDLGVETSPAVVPTMQKLIIAAANRHQKTVITATQMLESMIHAPRPTRAEASDVANAIYDGTDAVMLSAETASGDYPLETVKMMDFIVREAEDHIGEWGRGPEVDHAPSQDDAISITRAAHELALDRNVSAIAVFTQNGRTALLMSKTRPSVPILAFTPEKKTYQRLGLMWGVTPFFIPYASTVESMLSIVEAAIISSTPLKPGQQIVLITGFPVGQLRPPNFALLHTIGELQTRSAR